MRNLSVKLLLIGLVSLALAAGQDLNASQLKQLYGTRVKFAQRFERSTGVTSSSGPLETTRHAGVVVRTVNGDRWLIHKVRGQGTVVTKASYMSNRWKAVTRRKRIRHSTVRDYVVAGGKEYNLLWDNSLFAARRMMALT